MTENSAPISETAGTLAETTEVAELRGQLEELRAALHTAESKLQESAQQQQLGQSMKGDRPVVLSRGASAVEEDLMIVQLQKAHEAQMEADLCEMDRMRQEIKELKERCRDSEELHKWDLEAAAALHEGV